MKKSSLQKSAGGSTLVTALCMVVVLAMVAGSVLSISSQEYRLSKRSHAWNQALFAAEGGIELGWNEMNKLTSINSNGTFMAGWSATGVNTWSITNQTMMPLAGIENASTYSITVTTNSPAAGEGTLTAEGKQTSATFTDPAVRKVQVTIRPNQPFSMAMLAKGLIDFNGNTAVVDSFNSTSGDYSAGTARAHGNIGTNGQLIDAAGLDVSGSLKTGPGGQVTTQSGFNMYQPAPPDTGTNTTSDGLRVSIPNSKLPWTATGAIVPPTVAGKETLTAGTHVDVTIGTLNQDLVITGSGTVRIYVEGAVSLAGQDDITVTPSPPGSSLKVEMYVRDAIDLSGNGVVNPSSKPTDFLLYGLPTCTSVQISGTADFKGAIYAPNATATLNGGARVDGSLVASTINAVGTIDFHYDEALATVGPITSFSIATWKEQ